MAAFRIDRPGANPDVLSCGVRFPSILDRGSGTLTIALKPGSLASGRRIEVDLADSPIFKISTTISCGRKVDAMLLGSSRNERRSFVIPPDVDTASSHVLRIEFARWKIGRAAVDERSLTEAGA